MAAGQNSVAVKVKMDSLHAFVLWSRYPPLYVPIISSIYNKMYDENHRNPHRMCCRADPPEYFPFMETIFETHCRTQDPHPAIPFHWPPGSLPFETLIEPQYGSVQKSGALIQTPNSPQKGPPNLEKQQYQGCISPFTAAWRALAENRIPLHVLPCTAEATSLETKRDPKQRLPSGF